MEELRAAIMAVYEPEQLRQSLRDIDNIDIELYDHKKFDAKIDALLRDITKEGRAPRVLRALADRRPHQPEFQEFIQEYLKRRSPTPVTDALLRLKENLKIRTSNVGESIKNHVALFLVAMFIGGATTAAVALSFLDLNLMGIKVENVVIRLFDNDDSDVTDIADIFYKDKEGKQLPAIKSGVNLQTIPLNRINNHSPITFVLNKDSARLRNNPQLSDLRQNDIEFQIAKIAYPSATSKDLLIYIRMNLKKRPGM